jgi:hypothetical protein
MKALTQIKLVAVSLTSTLIENEWLQFYLVNSILYYYSKLQPIDPPHCKSRGLAADGIPETHQTGGRPKAESHVQHHA